MSKPPTSGTITLDRLSDRALFARAAVDEAAFAIIVRRYREPLRRHAARYVGDADAEDVVQQALVNASLAIRREPDRDIEPKPWLYKVTTNAAIDHRRAQSVRPLGDRAHEEVDLDAVSEAPDGDPHDVLARRESLRSMVAGIQDLAPNQRRAATARFMEGRSHDEIASELGVSKGAARELIHRARRNLREAIPALSPVPLFIKLRESLTALFAGSGSVSAAKLTVGAVAVIVAAGAGGIAIKKAGDDDGATPAKVRELSGAAPSVPEASPVAERPRDNGGGHANAKGQGDEKGGGSGGGKGSAGGSGSAASTPSETGGSDAAAPAPAAPASGGSGAVSDPVQDVTDQLPVDDVANQVDHVTDQVNSATNGLGVDVPDLPNVGQALGGGG